MLPNTLNPSLYHSSELSLEKVSGNWEVSTTQTDESKWRDQDLQTAEISLTTNTSTKITTGSATMKHRMGLAKINMKTWSNVKNVMFYIAAPAAVKDVNYTWDNQAYTNVTSSSTYTSTAKPWQNTTHWYVMDTNTTFTTSATTTGVSSYSGQGVASTTTADVVNNNSWTTTLTYTSGNCVDFTPTITATEFLSKVPYTLALGDVFYSNGAVSKPTSKFTSLTAIGILAYIAKDAYTEQNYGGGHALVLALKPESNNKRQWGAGASGSGYTRVDIPGSTNVSNTSTMLNATTGYANTFVHVPAAGYQISNFPALYYGVENGNTPYPTPKGPGGKSTGWFLPSISQWCKVIASPGIGNIAQSFLAYNSNVTAGATAVANINNALSAAGGTVTLQSGVNNGVYWTSSENGSSGQDAVNIGLFASSINFTENGYGNYKYDPIQLWSMLAF